MRRIKLSISAAVLVALVSIIAISNHVTVSANPMLVEGGQCGCKDGSKYGNWDVADIFGTPVFYCREVDCWIPLSS